MTNVSASEVYASKIRYLASVFVDARHAVATPKDVGTLLAALDDDRLLPTTIQEVGPGGITQRIAFNSADQSILLALTGTRFDYSYQATSPLGNSLGNFKEFCHDADQKLNIALAHFKLRGNRLAAVQEGYLPEMSLAESQKIASNLLKVPPTYSDKAIREWSWRINSTMRRKVNSQNESMNMIVAAGNMRGYAFLPGTTQNLERVDVDKIRVDFDINTLPENVAARFNKIHVHSFLSNVPIWQEEFVDEILTLMYDGVMQ